MSTHKATLRQQLIAAMRETGLSDYEIARRSGIERATLSRFVRGTGGLTLVTLERLVPVLGIRFCRDAIEEKNEVIDDQNRREARVHAVDVQAMTPPMTIKKITYAKGPMIVKTQKPKGGKKR